MTANALLAALRARELSCAEAAAAALGRMGAGAALGAWAATDPDGALAAAARLDAEGPGGRPLFGLPVGVKDVWDASGLPTGLGARAGAGGRGPAAPGPAAVDAAVVAALRAAGAVVVGKTACTEYACLGPTDVRHPRLPGRSPGGSSSGSAAAVAAGHVTVALGTQTAGSVCRPAAYCGVVGFKPTRGALDRRGVFEVSPTLDTLGFLTASVADAALLAAVLLPAGGAPGPARGGAPRLALARTGDWPRTAPEVRAAVEAAVAGARDRGAVVTDVDLPGDWDALVAAQRTVQAAETARALRAAGVPLSAQLATAVADGCAIPEADHRAARARIAAAAEPVAALLAGVDALLTPATLDLPPGLPSTGDPHPCRAWTALGTPVVTVPVGTQAAPAGLQVVAAPGADRRALAVAAWLTG